PADFSGLGYTANTYQFAHWYPEPAVYDRTAWHPIPYLDHGGSYSEFGSFDVRITVPKGFIVAATGLPRDTANTTNDRTFHYTTPAADDFSWSASRHFKTLHDTLRLPSGRVIDIYSYFTPKADT